MSNKDDSISRKEALKICRRYWHPTSNPIMEEIGKLPPVQSEPHWIPCSERLPQKTGEYLVTKISIGWNYEEYTENDIAYWDNHKGFCKTEKVIAWMPIPEPYKEGATE